MKPCTHPDAAPLGRLIAIRGENTIVMRCPDCHVRWRETPDAKKSTLTKGPAR